MNNAQYIAALKKALSGMDKTSRADIIRELDRHANESQTLLSDRFDAPELLAKQYLDEEIAAKPIGNKIWGISRKLVIAIALITLALLLIAALTYWWLSRDQFNYADENAAELSDKNPNWSSMDVPDNLKLKTNQSTVTIYWHDSDSIRWSCDGNSPRKEDEGSTVLINQSQCLIYLPASVTRIDANQTQLVLVRPQSSINIAIKQSSLRIAENGVRYRYETDIEKGTFKDLSSRDNADHTIRINAIETTISAY